MPLPLAPAPAPIAAPSAPQGAPAPAGAAQAAPTPAELPSPFSHIAAGELPAVALPAEKRNADGGPLSQYVQQNLHNLVAAGIDIYESRGKESVFFNPTKVSLEELKKADAKGDLFKLAPLIPGPKVAPAKSPATLTLHGRSAVPAPDAAPGPLAGAQAAPAPINPTAKPSRKLQDARLNAVKQPSVDTPGVGPLDQLAKRAF